MKQALGGEWELFPPQGPPLQEQCWPSTPVVQWEGHGKGMESHREPPAVGSCCCSPPGFPFPVPSAAGWGILALLPLSGIPQRVPWVLKKELLASPPADTEVEQNSQPVALPIPTASRACLQPASAQVVLGMSQVLLSLPAAKGALAAASGCSTLGDQPGVLLCAGATKDMGKMLGGEEEKDPDAQKKEEERQEALRQQEEERKAKHARMEAEREKVRQQIRDKVGTHLPCARPCPWQPGWGWDREPAWPGGGWPKSVAMGTGHSAGSACPAESLCPPSTG